MKSRIVTEYVCFCDIFGRQAQLRFWWTEFAIIFKGEVHVIGVTKLVELPLKKLATKIDFTHVVSGFVTYGVMGNNIFSFCPMSCPI